MDVLATLAASSSGRTPLSITSTLEKDLPATEFVMLPVFGCAGQPEYQIEIHIRRPDILMLYLLNTALENAQNELTPGVLAH
jgi:hypothetical protein